MGSSHHHAHDHSHESPSGQLERAFLIGIILNFAFVGVELTYGWMAHSLSLMADAGHNFSDVVGLALSWMAIWLSKKEPSERYTYGFRRSSILASLVNSVVLLISVGVILVEAAQRWLHPVPVESGAMIWVAAVGILVNAGTAILFFKDRHHDLNVGSSFTHMAADAAISLGVVVSGVLIHFTHWTWVDPLVSILISLVIIWGTWRILAEATSLAVDAVPVKVQPQEVLGYLEKLDGVVAVHHLHIWGLSTTEVAMTVHLVIQSGLSTDPLLLQLSEELKNRFFIDHPTIQIESATPSLTCILQE